jgi:hypothetical protein
LVTPKTTREIVYASTVPAESKDDIITTVIAGAQWIFATLVCIDKLFLLNNFIRYDEFQNDSMDKKPPMDREKLEKIFGKPEVEAELKKLPGLHEQANEQQIKHRDELEMKKFDVGK